MTAAQAINKVIQIAEAEVGYLEKKSNASLYDKTANAGSANYTKYWADIAPAYQAQAWCACFVTWCLVQAFGKEKAAQLLKHYPYISCPKISTLFTLNANPKRGDIVIFYRSGVFAHTGIVTGVNGDYFTTVEGNTSGGSTIISNGGAVCKKGYYNSKLPGTKFITLDYSILGNEEELSMTQYEELKALITARDAEIAELKATNARLMKAVESTFVFNYNDDNVPAWAKDALTAAMRCGAVQGDENGELHLSYKDLRTIVREYRCGMYNMK